MITLAATGHRPDKLGGYGPEVTKKLKFLASDYLKSRPEIIREGIVAISGLALGWDTAWALAALELNIPLIAAVPFRGQERKWPKESQEAYRDILFLASEIVIVSEGEYAVWKMHERNEWMVDHSDELVALWNGTPGGTANCIKYANKFKKPVRNLWDLYDNPDS